MGQEAASVLQVVRPAARYYVNRGSAKNALRIAAFCAVDRNGMFAAVGDMGDVFRQGARPTLHAAGRGELLRRTRGMNGLLATSGVHVCRRNRLQELEAWLCAAFALDRFGELRFGADDPLCVSHATVDDKTVKRIHELRHPENFIHSTLEVPIDPRPKGRMRHGTPPVRRYGG